MKGRRLFQIVCGLGSMVVLLQLLSTRYVVFSSSFWGLEEIKPQFTDIYETGQITFNQENLPSEDNSKLSLVGSASFKLGDDIRVEIHLRDHTGSKITRGGDVILCWMTNNKRNGASLTGSVVDHVNGTYTGVLRAMWTGRVTIKCAIGCTREGFHMIMKYFQHHGPSKKMFCIFENNKHKVKTIGQTSVLNNSNVCNLTAENYGMPWYCVRPGVAGVRCGDWTKVSHEEHNIKTLYDDKPSILYYLRATSHRVFTSTINITIKPEATPALPAPKPCREDDLANTWKWTSPVGYFYNNTWWLTNCRLNYSIDYHKCFQNRRMVMFGDSTVRQLFLNIFSQLRLKFSTQAWNVSNWHRQSVAYKENYNFTLVWTRHGLPIYFGESNRGETRPVYVHLDQIPPGSNDIILINSYAHFQYHDPTVVRRSLKMVVSSLKSLLRRSPDVRIAMKGSHYFSFRDRKTLGGMWGPLYDDILKEEFRGLYSKVHFINVWDMTVARENIDIHPLPTLVKSMLNVFLSYVCS